MIRLSKALAKTLPRQWITKPWLGLGWLTLALGVSACGQAPTTPPKPAAGQAPATPAPALGSWGVQTRYIAQDINPGDDFYRYVNAGWLATSDIPQGLARYSAFTELTLAAERQTQAIITQLGVQKAPRGTPAQQISELYSSYVDLNVRNTLGVTMFQRDIADILAARDHFEIAALMGRVGYPSLFISGATLDPANPSRYMVEIGQGGLGLPDRDYYLRDLPPYTGYRQQYVAYIEFLLQRIGFRDATAKAQEILQFETALAEVHWTRAAKRDVLRMYQPMSLTQLSQFAPGFFWERYLRASRMPTEGDIFVSTDTAVQQTARLFAQADLQMLKCYLAAQLINRYAHLLSNDLVAAHFALYSRTLQGIAEPRPLEVRAVRFVNDYLGEQVGKLYVEQYFPAAHKQAMEELVGYVVQAFQQRLASNPWMDEATRDQAFAKLAAFRTKIGYPEQWHDYADLEIARLELVNNVRRIERWHHRQDLKRLEEGRREWEWSMTPQTVNAYYSPLRNEIVFPAAILQPPFFDPHADPAVNFGAIGMVIGHELGHGFDDQGSRFDSAGRLREWWTAPARTNFDDFTARLVEQYNQYTPLAGNRIDGALTLGENIGDLGGLAIAFTAWQNYQREHYPDAPPVRDGVSADQRFFLSYAQMWRSLYQPDALRQMLVTGPHSPAQYRVNGVLRNFDPWYSAFSIDAEADLYLQPLERVRIW